MARDVQKLPVVIVAIFFIALSAIFTGCSSSEGTENSPSPTGTTLVAASTTPAAHKTVTSPTAVAVSSLPPAPLLASLPASAPRARHVIIISIDGLRPDVLLRARTPAIRQLMRNGSFTFYARTVDMAYTLPAHISMLTGVVPERHGVTWNNHIEEAYSNVPTIFDLAKKHGYTTAAVTGKTKFIVLQRPGSLDFATFGLDVITPDELTAKRAGALIAKQKPGVLFVHLAEVDEIGHTAGWGSDEQLAAAVRADQGVRIVMQALIDNNLLNDTAVIVTSDHGGEGKNHGPQDDRSMLIPWIISGPGIRKDFDLTSVVDLTVKTEDTFATACYILGIAAPGPLDGRPVTAVFENDPPNKSPAK